MTQLKDVFKFPGQKNKTKLKYLQIHNRIELFIINYFKNWKEFEKLC